MVKKGAGVVLLGPRLMAVIHLRDDILKRRKVGAGGVESQRRVARGGVASRHHVVLRAGPPDTNEFFHRVANGGGLLDRRGVHHTPAPPQRPVRSKLATALQPGRLLLTAGASDRNSTDGKPFLLGQPPHCRARPLPVPAP